MLLPDCQCLRSRLGRKSSSCLLGRHRPLYSRARSQLNQAVLVCVGPTTPEQLRSIRPKRAGTGRNPCDAGCRWDSIHGVISRRAAPPRPGPRRTGSSPSPRCKPAAATRRSFTAAAGLAVPLLGATCGCYSILARARNCPGVTPMRRLKWRQKALSVRCRVFSEDPAHLANDLQVVLAEVAGGDVSLMRRRRRERSHS